MTETSLVRQEIECYSMYLLGMSVDEQSIQLFERATKQHVTDLSENEIKVLEFMIQNPYSVGFIDAALGLFFHDHRLRRRMTIAFAIFETNPLYYNFFCPRPLPGWYFFNLVFKGIKEGIMALTGRIILFFF